MVFEGRATTQTLYLFKKWLTKKSFFCLHFLFQKAFFCQPFIQGFGFPKKNGIFV